MRKGFKAEFHISDKFVDLGKLFLFQSLTHANVWSLIQLIKGKEQVIKARDSKWLREFTHESSVFGNMYL